MMKIAQPMFDESKEALIKRIEKLLFQEVQTEERHGVIRSIQRRRKYTVSYLFYIMIKTEQAAKTE